MGEGTPVTTEGRLLPRACEPDARRKADRRSCCRVRVRGIASKIPDDQLWSLAGCYGLPSLEAREICNQFSRLAVSKKKGAGQEEVHRSPGLEEGVLFPFLASPALPCALPKIRGRKASSLQRP